MTLSVNTVLDQSLLIVLAQPENSYIKDNVMKLVLPLPFLLTPMEINAQHVTLFVNFVMDQPLLIALVQLESSYFRDVVMPLALKL